LKNGARSSRSGNDRTDGNMEETRGVGTRVGGELGC